MRKCNNKEKIMSNLVIKKSGNVKPPMVAKTAKKSKKKSSSNVKVVGGKDYLEKIRDAVNSSSGVDICTLAGDTVIDVAKASTNIPSLDSILKGGLPIGRIMEFYGNESCGKTTAALQYAGVLQKLKKTVALIDVEHALDKRYAKKLGVNIDDLIHVEPEYGEQALQVVDLLIDQKVDLIVIDSVSALTPKKELEGEMGEHNVGTQAKLMSQALRKVTAKAKKNNITIIFINQLRQKIGPMVRNPDVTSGGKSLAFYASVRLEFKYMGVIKTKIDGAEVVIGRNIKTKLVKDKTGGMMGNTIELDVINGLGFDRERDMAKFALKMGIFNRSGAWYSYNGNNIGQGLDKTMQFLKDNPDVADEVSKKLLDLDLEENKESVEEIIRENAEPAFDGDEFDEEDSNNTPSEKVDDSTKSE
jgi:recombination protein RecA